MKKMVIISLILFLFFSVNAEGTTTTGTFTPLSSANPSPIQSDHLVWNGHTEKTLNATDVNVSSVSINFTIADPNGNIMDWYMYHKDGGTWRLVDSDIGVHNGTVTTTNVSWFRQTTNYSVSFNITDGVNWSNVTRWFITDYSVPQISDPDPANGSTIAVSSYSWNVNITDFVPFNWTIECSNGQGMSNNMSTNGTFYLNLTGLVTLTLYRVFVNVTNGNMSSNMSFIFTVIIPAPGTHGGTGGGGLYVPPPDETVVKKEAVPTEGEINLMGGIGILVVSFFVLIIFLKRRKEKKEVKE